MMSAPLSVAHVTPLAMSASKPPPSAPSTLTGMILAFHATPATPAPVARRGADHAGDRRAVAVVVAGIGVDVHDVTACDQIRRVGVPCRRHPRARPAPTSGPWTLGSAPRWSPRPPDRSRPSWRRPARMPAARRPSPWSRRRPAAPDPRRPPRWRHWRPLQRRWRLPPAGADAPDFLPRCLPPAQTAKVCPARGGHTTREARRLRHRRSRGSPWSRRSRRAGWLPRPVAIRGPNPRASTARPRCRHRTRTTG